MGCVWSSLCVGWGCVVNGFLLLDIVVLGMLVVLLVLFSGVVLCWRVGACCVLYVVCCLDIIW